MSAAKQFHDLLLDLLKIERRFDPFFRPAFDALFQEPLAALAQLWITRSGDTGGLKLAEERSMPGEDELLEQIIQTVRAFMETRYRPGMFERGGNTKTHGIVRGDFIVRDDLAPEYRHGVFNAPRSFRAWVRFGGPGPASPPDIDDVGVLSIGVKLMGVPGPKLLEDEKFTQDFTGISTPTFTTPDVCANAKLQAAIGRGTPLFHFLNFSDPHVLDGVMQGLWARTHTSPLETRYWSCVPYLLGAGRAMQYSFRPHVAVRTRIPRLPLRPSDNYLRENMASTLSQHEAVFDFLVQLQTDAGRMPIENASVRWPEKLSPPVAVATLRLPRQTFDLPAQLAFAHRLALNPWHCVPEHRPLGNQNRARRRVYQELSRFRQLMNATPHIEPTGDEAFS